MSPTTRLDRRAFLLSLAVAAWLPAGLALALWAPWHAGGSPTAAAPALSLAVGLLVAAGWLAVTLVARSGRTLDALPSLVLASALCGLLFAQLAAFRGAARFEADRAPLPADWVTLAAAEAVRAADLLDVLDLFPPPPRVRPASADARAVAAVLRLLVAAFVFRLLGEWSGRVRLTVFAALRLVHPGAREVFRIPGFFVVFAVGAIAVGTAVLFGREADSPGAVLRWLADQALAVADVADLLRPAALAPDGVRPTPAAAVLTLLVRAGILATLVFAVRAIFRRLSLAYLGGAGIAADELADVFLAAPAGPARDVAGRRLFDLSVEDPPARWPTLLVAACVVLGAAGVYQASAALDDASGRISAALGHAAALVAGDDPRAADAAAALSRMGVSASPAAAVLHAGLVSVPPERRRVIFAVLGGLGPDAVPLLAERLGDADCRPAADALAAIGGPAVEAMVRARLRAVPTSADAIDGALTRVGRRALPGLMSALTPDNAAKLVPLLSAIDSRWYVSDPVAPAARAVRTARIALALIDGTETPAALGRAWADDDATRIEADLTDAAGLASHLADLGPTAAASVPALVEHLRHERTPFGAGRLLAGLRRLGPSVRGEVARCREVYPEVRERLDGLLAEWE